jgi:hypothetical protein
MADTTRCDFYDRFAWARVRHDDCLNRDWLTFSECDDPLNLLWHVFPVRMS